MIENTAILAQKFDSPRGITIPKNAAVYIITADYLMQSNYSPSDYDQLLRNAEAAKSKNYRFVEWDRFLEAIPEEFFL
jgi:hypothetical protein